MEEKDEPLLLKDPDLSGTYTAKDYLKWQLDELVELIRGKIFRMSPSPASNHQRIAGELHIQLRNYFDNYKKCEVFIAPFDVYLVKQGQDYKETENIVEPDLTVICEPDKVKSFGCVGSPDLIVEILSPSTSKKDTKLKFELYEEYGVREYWVVSPEKKSVIIYALKNGKYHALRQAVNPGVIRSGIFSELEIDLEIVFKRVQ